MKTHACWFLVLTMLALPLFAAEMATVPFVETLSPASGEITAPRSIVADARTGRRYVLDGGSRRLLVFDTRSEQVQAMSLSTLGMAEGEAMPADPLLPAPALAVTRAGVYLLRHDRAARKLALDVVDGSARGRVVALPDSAANGAAVLDADGRVLLVALRVSTAGVELVVTHEDDGGEFATLGTLKNPCDGQSRNLFLTGIALDAEGQLAVGIAQASESAAYSYVRSWLVRGLLDHGALAGEMQVTHRFALLDGRGKVLDRFRPHVELAGRAGYPAKPCVPLFTSLVFGVGGTVISGGHSADPLLRVYRAEGALDYSHPRSGVGGQHVAVLVSGGAPRVFVTNLVTGRIDEITLDGRVIGGCGRPLAFDLSRPVSLAADRDGVYAVVRADDRYRLLRFTRAGQLTWSTRVAPPRGFDKALPHLAAPTGERVFIGWRQPGAAGVGAVEVVLEDGMPGTPLWAEAFAGIAAKTEHPSPTPIVAGINGRLYVLREQKDGARVQVFSATGAALQLLPAEIRGVSTVKREGTLAWARRDQQWLTLALYTAQGAASGWKRVREDGEPFPVAWTGAPWGWLASARLLLRFDTALTLVEELTVLTPEGEAIQHLPALAGDGIGRLYLALPGRIVMIEP